MSLTLEELQKITGSSLIGDPQFTIEGARSLEDAGEREASYLASEKYLPLLKSSKAGVVITTPDLPREEGKRYLLCEEPLAAFEKVLSHFHQDLWEKSAFCDIHPTAVIDRAAVIADGVRIGPHAVIDRGVSIGKGTRISAGVYIGPETVIGDHCRIMPHVAIREGCAIGNRVAIDCGTVIGSCGYGYKTDQNGLHQKEGQYGNVVIEDDVEIGAQCTIDRARFNNTVIKKGTKIDNLVNIGHNVEIGEHNLIVAQTGIAGSSKTGRYVVLGGQVGIVDHVELEDGTRVASKSGISKSLKSGTYNGIPVQPIQEYNRTMVHVRNLDKMAKRLKELETIIMNSSLPTSEGEPK